MQVAKELNTDAQGDDQQKADVKAAVHVLWLLTKRGNSCRVL